MPAEYKVMVVDDNPRARDSVAEMLEDIDMIPMNENGPLVSIDHLLKEAKSKAISAAIFDHRLTASNYAGFLGAEAASAFYSASIPSLLVTQWSSEGFDSIKRYRKNIPVLIKSDELDPSMIENGFNFCIQEMAGNYSKRRRPWRTLIRIEEVDTSQKPVMAYAIIPSWNPRKGVKIPFDIFSADLISSIKEGTRLVAKVNIGAVDLDELYFYDFELAKKRVDIDAIAIRN